MGVLCRRSEKRGGVCYLPIVMLLVTGSCVHEASLDALPDGEGPTVAGCTNGGEVCFESSVLPIFLSSCSRTGCHNAETQEDGYILDTYSNIVRKGISPGNADESKLYRVLFEDGEDRMPPDEPLSKAQQDSIAAWINQGAKNTTDCNCFCDSTQYSYTANIEPIINTYCVGCHKPGTPGGNIDLTGYNNVKMQAVNGKLWGSITHASGFQPMPQGGKLSDCQIRQIRNWIDAGVMNN
ncbi:MAG TPA: c-type cytochrome domain-containing protein [Chryseosolibacter sp.]|nr:c-type cytochrome domain-containing protein [Chryseosolibacter sp.]